MTDVLKVAPGEDEQRQRVAHKSHSHKQGDYNVASHQ